MVAEIALKYAQVGQYDQAFQIATTIRDASSRVGVLTAIARKCAEAGQYEQAFQIATTLEDDSDKAVALAQIARKELAHTYPEGGQQGKALEALFDVKEAWQDAHSQDKELAEIALKYAELGQHAKALEIANTIEVAFAKALTLTEVAGTCAETGYKEKAAQILAQALEVANTIGDTSAKETALAAVGSLYAQAGQNVDDSAKKVLHEIIGGLGEKAWRE